MTRDPLRQQSGTAPDVINHDGNDSPACILNAAESGLVAKHRASTGVPIDTFVFRCYPRIRPREVDTPAFSTAPFDEVLQFRARKAVIEHGEARFTFHRRFGARVGVAQQRSNCQNPTPPTLLTDGLFQVGTAAPSRTQCRIEGRKRPRTGQPSGDFHRCPCWRGSEPAGNPLQRCASTLMNHKSFGGAHPDTRVQDMNCRGVFDVKPVKRRRGTQTCDGWTPTHEHVQRRQPTAQIWLCHCVDSVPDSCEPTILHTHIKLLTRHHGQELGRGQEGTELFDQVGKARVHNNELGLDPRVHVFTRRSRCGYHCEQTQNRTRRVEFMRFCVCSRTWMAGSAELIGQRESPRG